MADFYETLGVARDASQEEIKKAYRKLARKLHPDVAGPDGAEQFKEVTAAYEVLSNEEKRRMYDMGGEDALHGGFSGAGAGGFGGAFEDIFSTFFGGGSPFGAGGGQAQPRSRARRGGDTLVQLDVDLENVVFGGEQQLAFSAMVECSTCHGAMTAPGTEPVTCTNCHGTGQVQRVSNSIFGQMVSTTTCPQCQGFGTTIVTPCPDCAGEGRVRASRSITIDVPAGIDDGMQIRLAGQGDAGVGGGPAGDLFAHVHVQDHSVFTRDGDDLRAAVEVPMTAAALGLDIAIDTFDGEQSITVEPGTQSGTEVRLNGLGVGRLHRRGRGDLIVSVNVKTPTKLDAEQREIIEKLARLRGEDAVSGKVLGKGDSFFARMKRALTGEE
ncbi:MAG: molecular chaperone DnaJ [Actinomycetaceae bacterium]|nr:molecular chaperone DnaJ [Arcanobacterium sp.]MDD7686351.1 molecular chaperone DnaJ [Actinomycetaceae bacterium]MDY5274210.1 molecular chaperone DnaJ [Arcanobacterium sp.]